VSNASCRCLYSRSNTLEYNLTFFDMFYHGEFLLKIGVQVAVILVCTYTIDQRTLQSHFVKTVETIKRLKCFRE